MEQLGAAVARGEGSAARALWRREQCGEESSVAKRAVRRREQCGEESSAAKSSAVELRRSEQF